MTFEMHEDYDNMESDFLALVRRNTPVQSVFEMGALDIIGEDWREVGRLIVEENEPELLKTFESYV